ncbi:MAG: hypothetical protein ABJA98_21085 [Acidobacteriota bacterium]
MMPPALGRLAAEKAPQHLALRLQLLDARAQSPDGEEQSRAPLLLRDSVPPVSATNHVSGTAIATAAARMTRLYNGPLRYGDAD